MRATRSSILPRAWAYGCHFCIIGRDVGKKTTLDSPILHFYWEGGAKHNILEPIVYHPLQKLPVSHKGVHLILYLVNKLFNMVNKLLNCLI
jgi:hypothetical protein